MPQRFRAACATVAALMAASVPGLSSPAHAATVTCADGVWKATYHANTTLTGTPRRTVCDAAISENYGTGAPAGTTLPKDNFSVRWTTARDFGSAGRSPSPPSHRTESVSTSTASGRSTPGGTSAQPRPGS
ncbi:hypothetical protein [Streptomyces sp. NBC_00259]|uniref:hypothetical protein n=1 Tax=Streptomyces sp. NBC_00259 TaxID=2903643 RepID=UPI002E2DBF9D|nr:hypothetical protein [Streptomyces sp. NBC_00259]